MRKIFRVQMSVITTAIVIAASIVLATPVQSQEDTNGEGDGSETTEEVTIDAEAEVVVDEEDKLPDTDDTAPRTLTTQDLTIPVDQLSLLIEPLTLDELQVEVDAWLYVLKARAELVSTTEIASRKEGQLLEDIANAEQQLEQARSTLQTLLDEEASDEEVREARSAVASSRREIARLKAQESALLLDESFLEAVADAEREQTLTTATAVLNDAEQQALALGDRADAVTEPLDDLSDAVEDYLIVQADIDRVVPGTTLYRSSVRKLEQRREEVEEATEAVADLSALDITLPTEEELEDGLRLQLVEDAARLAASQPAIVSRFQIILDEFTAKGGDTEPYDKYIASVTGLDLDVTDAEGLTVKLLTWLQSEEGGIRVGIDILKFASILIIAAALAPRIGKISEVLLQRVEAMSSLFRDFTVVFIKRGVLLLGLVLALASIGVNLGPILALIGGASFVLAFALQSNLGNFASGLLLLVSKPFDVGDEVKVGGYWASVDSISLANTKLMGFDGSLITLPNNMVWSGDIINYTHADVRKITFGADFKFTEDYDKVKQIWLDLAESHPKVLDTPGPGVFPWNSHYNSRLSLWLGAWSKKDDFWAVYPDLVLGLKQRLMEAGIELAAPLQEIKVDGVSGQKIVDQLPASKETVDV